MGIPIACADARKECEAFSGRLKIMDNILALIAHGDGAYMYALLWIEAVRDYMRTQKLIRRIRETLSSCETSCDNAACLAMFYETASKIRDNYLNLYKSVEGKRIPSFFLGRLTEKSLDDWDDLAVDCKIGGDDEFRRLVMQIAENA